MLSNILKFGKKQKRLFRFLFASTSEVYAGTLLKASLTIPTPENSNILLPDLDLPRTSYMLSKIYGEAMCLASNMPIINIRPHNIYGPRMGFNHVVPQLIKRIFETEQGGELGVYSPSHTRVFCYVDDAVSLIYKLIFNCKNKVLTTNLGNCSPEIKILDLAKIIIEKMDRKDINIFELSETEGSPKRRAPNIDRLIEITNMETRISIDEGLERTIKWYLNYLKN